MLLKWATADNVKVSCPSQSFIKPVKPYPYLLLPKTLAYVQFLFMSFSSLCISSVFVSKRRKDYIYSIIAPENGSLRVLFSRTVFLSYKYVFSTQKGCHLFGDKKRHLCSFRQTYNDYSKIFF